MWQKLRANMLVRRPPEVSTSEAPVTLRQVMLSRGWLALDSRTHPRAYVNHSGSRFGTLEKDGVRIALSLGQSLGTERGVSVVYMTEELSDVIVRALLVDPDHRGQGKATCAMTELTKLADSIGTMLYLEPCPIDNEPMDAESLSIFYAHFGFERPVICSNVMVRKPR